MRQCYIAWLIASPLGPWMLQYYIVYRSIPPQFLTFNTVALKQNCPREAMPGARREAGELREGSRVIYECDSCVFDEYVQYVYSLLLWLLSWEVALVLLAGPRPCLGLLKTVFTYQNLP